MLLLPPALANPDLDAERALARDVFATLTTELHEPRVLPPAPPTTRAGANLLDLYVAGDLALAYDTKGGWLLEASTHVFQGDLQWILDTISVRFYQDCGDDYQYLNVMIVNDLGFFGAFYSPMANDVVGIGYDALVRQEVFDTSSNQLEGFIFMNAAELWANYPSVGRYVFGQEFGHRWGAFVNVTQEGVDPDVLLGRDLAHWSYWMDTPNSPMEGNDWGDNGDGTWTVDVRSGSTYSELDLYLMGFLPPEDVAPLTVLAVSDEDAAALGREPASTPEYLADEYGGASRQITVAGTPIEVPLDSIIAAEGARSPTAEESPRTFRMATVILVLSTDVVDDDALAMIDGVRTAFEADWEEDARGLASLDTTLGDCTAPTWGDTGGPEETATDTAEDSGGADTALDETGETGGTGGTKEPGGCGCAAPGVPAASWLALLALPFLRRSAR